MDWGYGASLSFDAVTSSGGSNGTVGKIQSRWQSAGNHALDFYAFASNSLVQKARLDADGLDVTGSVTADNIYLADKMYHEGDTNTYVGFNAADSIVFHAGGWSTLSVYPYYLTCQGSIYNYYNYFDESSQLTGTTPTINATNSGNFYLTMTGNTTFTFSNTSSNWAVGFTLYLTGNGGTVDFTTNNNVTFAGGTAPDAPANGETDVYVFHTRDGSNWVGALAVDAAA